ncbi:hypothetical protein HPB48_008967 [Haemaphysalis longicornis]|uniref:CCHC-type domain-containing protein n=1 Tax=Haemaphysalis longicornis TaxID=44386 RepID=A0A9J6GD56_HAELO|nr:hypothetical protein HPB48_008967 [Haemaphysalis longicornis]
MTSENDQTMSEESPEDTSEGAEGGGARISFDENSGRTVYQTMWLTELHRRGAARKKEEEGKLTVMHGAASKQELEGATSSGKKENPATGRKKSTASKSPPLPEMDYKVVYRPPPGLQLAKWKDSDAAIAMARAMNMPLKDFVNQVTTQVQWTQNLLLASTPHEELVDRLAGIAHLQVGSNVYKFVPYLKPLPNTSAGVVVGITDWLTNDNIMEYITAPRHEIVSARRLGNSSAALLHFKGPHVPFYVKVLGAITRCRPYRKSVQFCRACGNIGHRQDVCPSPKPELCVRCGIETAEANHDCHPVCKLCNQPHETASKECKRRLRPAPPPLHVRQARLQKGGTASSGTACGSVNPESSTTSTSFLDGILRSSSSRSRSRSRSKSRATGKSRSRSRSITRFPSTAWKQNCGEHNRVMFSNVQFPPLVAAPTDNSNDGKGTPDWVAPFEALKRNVEENTRMIKELVKQNSSMMQEIMHIRQQQAIQDKETLQMKEDLAQIKHGHAEFQRTVLGLFQQIQEQIQDIHKTQQQIQETNMTILNEMKDLDKRVTVLEEKDKARKKPKNYPGREARMEEMLEYDE